MHATCMCILLLLSQCMHAESSTFRVSVRFCFSVGIMVSGGGGVGRTARILFSQLHTHVTMRLPISS